jgi:DmsE family decaheme c-type cytochrome
MHRDRRVARLLGAVSEGSSIRQVCLLLLLGAIFFSIAARGASGRPKKTADAPTAQQAAQGDFVGGDTCAACHDEIGKSFTQNPHSRLAELHNKTGVTCESCHGPGKAHVEGGGDVTKIFNPAKATSKEVDSKCLACHGDEHANFTHSAHAESNVSCLGCHSIHASKTPEHLLKVEQPNLCFQCHTDIKPQFNMPFHHKVEEGLVQCSDCHDPHGTFSAKQLRSSAQHDAVCTKCHTETAGPFVYEHDVVKTEGCIACHTPHGGPNPRLLNRANVNTICLQCHSPSPNFTTGPPMGPVHNQAAQYQSCTICHTAIHGSNVSSVFFDPY